MEGISGISGDDQLSAGGSEYGRSRKLMAEDANAAIRGAFAGGASEVLVNDSHGGQRNLLPEDLDPRARLISHSFKPYGMVQGLDDSFDAVLFVGYHAKASTPAGLFAHTGSGVVADVDVNGRSLGEGGLNTLMAAWYGVPVVLVTGDDVAVAEVKAVAAARGVVVKALNVRAVELAPLAAARSEIETAAREAVAAAARIPAQRTGPFRVRMRFKDTLIPFIAEGLPGLERKEPDTVAWTSDTMPAAYRIVRILYRIWPGLVRVEALTEQPRFHRSSSHPSAPSHSPGLSPMTHRSRSGHMTRPL
jgi:D-amino peptidase